LPDDAKADFREVDEADLRLAFRVVPFAAVGGAGGFVAEVAADDLGEVDDPDAVKS
jgi:hypothetical protein